MEKQSKGEKLCDKLRDTASIALCKCDDKRRNFHPHPDHEKSEWEIFEKLIPKIREYITKLERERKD